ncbi:MAG: FecR domain-containing protein [Tannerella sp.]|jgi:ferric-dicitrate binding protein FerR (iron transport regulator)|nr:FecR domain-containing protein [Tannerella sp.]
MKQKNYISEVIGRFFKEKHAVGTTVKVQRWLVEEAYKSEKEAALYELWENAGSPVNRRTLRALDQVKAELGMRVNSRGLLLKIASVVAFVLLLTGGIYYLSHFENAVRYATPNGEIRMIDLPDGSKVWMNAGSAVSYKNNGRVRTVKLSGEAFFRVAPDTLKPFTVETGTIIAEVLGTEFNIEDYPDSPRTAATLNTGRIRIRLPGDRDAVYVLDPGRQLVYRPSSGIEIQPVQADEIKSWKDGNLLFREASFEEIVHKMERRFNLKITVRHAGSHNDRYTVKFVNGETLEQMMDVLQLTVGDFTYETSANR